MARDTDRLSSLRPPRSFTDPGILVPAAAGVTSLWILTRLDPVFRDAMTPWRNSAVHAAMEWISLLGQGWMLAALALCAAAVAARRGRPDIARAGLVAVPALMVSGLVSRLIKILVARPRPNAVAETLDAWWPSLAAAHNSFPSGHATAVFTVAAVFALVAPSGRRRLYLAAAVVAFSRVAVDAHYVSDVVGGGLLGWTIGRLAIVTADRQWPRREGARAA